MVLARLFQPKRPTIPDYEIGEKLGEGGMGSVYRARHRATGREVAIKVLTRDLANDFEVLQRFEQEFRVASKLVHPNIVQALDFHREEAAPYLVMEYVAGESLGRRLDRTGRLPEAEAVRLIAQAAQALAYAHEHLVIHRDVKPDNLLLTADRRVKLSDLGLVKDIIGDRHLTTPLSVLGTTHFMAPEQYCDAKHVDARCDVYSLGATLYMAVTGELPFGECRSVAEVMRHVVSGELRPPRALVPALSEQVEEAIQRAMHPDPAQRTSSCLEFAKSLKRRRKRHSAPAAETAGGASASGRTPAQAGEYRVAVRYPFELGVSCAVDRSVHAGNVPAPDCWPAFVQDISPGGLALLLGRRLEAGTVVAVDIQPPNGEASMSLLARVLHVRPCGGGQWRVGCAFLEPLSPDQVRALL